MSLSKWRLLLLVGCGTLTAIAAADSFFAVRPVAAGPGAGLEQLPFIGPDGQTAMLSVQKTPVLDLADVESASVERKETPASEPRVRVVLTPQGRERFAEFTARAIHQRIAVMVDGKVCEAPVIQAKLTAPFIPVQCNVTEEQARELAARINAAAGRK
jgi:preprotein translocase subunit SecD